MKQLYWDRSLINIIGSYLLEFQDGLDKYILRDDLGTKKFFYGLNTKRKIVINKNFLNLINQCIPRTINSFPRSKLNKIINDKKVIHHEIDRKNNRAKVKGINMVKKHVKTTKEKKGGIVSKENFIHLSNLAIFDTKNKSEAKK